MKITPYLRNFLSLIFATIALNVVAQETGHPLIRDIALNSTADDNPERAHSPSIAKTGPFTGSNNNMVAAYTFETQVSGKFIRKVGIARSEDGGATWTKNKSSALGGGEITLNAPQWTSGGSTTLDNFDDAQLLTLSDPLTGDRSEKLILVVRAWSTASSTFYTGNQVHNNTFDGSIFLKSGIYTCVSTDGGNTWGKLNGGSFTAGSWHKVEENTWTSTAPATIEYPRIAFRSEYDDTKGYIVWTRKQYDVFDDPNDEDERLKYYVDNTKIGICAFNLDGKPFTSIFGSTETPYIPFSTSTDFPSGSFPERASVAISPDKQAWLSFYSVNYDGPSNSNDVNEGTAIPDMKVFFINGSATVSGTDCAFTFTGAPTKLIPRSSNSARHPMGCYKPFFGAIHNAAPVGSVINNIPQITLENGWMVDVASGPSIQVVTPNPINYLRFYDGLPTGSVTLSSCNQEYELGILYVHGQADAQVDGSAQTGTGWSFRSRLSFNSFHAVYGQTAGGIDQALVSNQSPHGYTIDAVLEELDWSVHNSNVGSDLRGLDQYYKRPDVFFFPRLNYTHTLAPTTYFHPVGPEEYRTINSYFITAYMASDMKVENYGGLFNASCFRHFQTHTGISFNSRTFRVSRFNTSDEERYILEAEPRRWAGDDSDDDEVEEIEPWKAFWGSKLDVCGEYARRSGGWTIHPIWRSIVPFNDISAARVKTNTAGTIFAKTSLKALPKQLNSNEISNIADGVIKTDNGPSTSFRWLDYAYFDFNNANRPPTLTAKTPFTFGNFGELRNKLASSPFTDGKNFWPTLPSGDVSYQYYLCVYDQYPAGEGFLNFSDQRRIVTTGEFGHAVVEKDDKVYYTVSEYHNALNESDVTAIAGGFSPRYKLSSTANVQRRPSITVYERGTTAYERTGLSSIAVTWVEFVPNTSAQLCTAKIFVKIREFETCSGKWNSWSEPYLIHSHTFSTNSLILGSFPNGDDETTPVIAAHAKPSTTGNEVNLLGWTVTWTCPRLSAMAPEHTVGSVYSRTLVRSNGTSAITDNTNWGAYPVAASGIFVPSAFSNPQYNKIFESEVAPPTAPQKLGFPTVTSSENKGILGKIYQEVAYSTDGSTPGIFTKSVTYGTSSIDLCSLKTMTQNGAASGSESRGYVLTALQLLNPVNGTWFTPLYFTERNPCITMNSSRQTFVAWEQMARFLQWTHGIWGIWIPIGFQTRSNIMVTHTVSNKERWQHLGMRNVKTIISKAATTFDFEWLRNPSIAGFPKTRRHDDLLASADKDPGVVELYYWTENELVGPTPTIANKLKDDFIFSEKPGTGRFLGQWHAHNKVPTISPILAKYSHRSFGLYNGGPTFVNTTSDEVNNEGRSYALGNLASDLNVFATFKKAAYKGTFDTLQGCALYRGSSIRRDSAIFRLAWGDVYVADSSSGLPERQVKLDFVQDTNGFSTLESYQLALFRTEVFDWFPGTEFSYWRSGFTSDSTCARPGGDFYDSSFSMKYTVELVHTSGAVDTIETFEFAPAYGKFIDAATMRVESGNISARDVYLRVRVQPTGFTADSSNCEMEMEFTEDPYTSDRDSNRIVYKRGNPMPIASSNSILLSAPYPNPINVGQTINMLLYMPKGAEANIEVRDVLGRSVLPTVSVVGTSDIERVSLPLNLSPGIYNLRILLGNNSEVYQVIVQ